MNTTGPKFTNLRHIMKEVMKFYIMQKNNFFQKLLPLKLGGCML